MRYERYLGKVTGTDDPEQRGRIKCICPDFIGEDVELPDWIDPMLDWGWFSIPDVDEIVELEILVSTEEDEVRYQSAIFDPIIRWRGKRFYGGEDTEALRPIPLEMTERNYGKRRGLITPRGHVLLFDDTEGDEAVRLSWHAVERNEDKYAFLNLDIHGITIANKNGTLLFFDSDNAAVLLNDEHGNVLAFDSDGARVVDKFGNMLVMRDGVVEVFSQGGVAINAANNVDVACDKATVEAQTEAVVKALAVTLDGTASISLGNGAAQPGVLGTILETWLASHVHTSAAPTLPTSPPTVPPAGILSALVKLK